jgi:hypothetical protein
MKAKKTFKSFTELPDDAIGAVEPEPEKAKSPKAQALAEAPRKNPPNTFPPVHDLHHWGINE